VHNTLTETNTGTFEIEDKMKRIQSQPVLIRALCVVLVAFSTCHAFAPNQQRQTAFHRQPVDIRQVTMELSVAAEEQFATTELDDAVIRIKMTAMERLRELKTKQDDPSAVMVLKMGVRNGGCSGLSYGE